ncbi:transmembrane E3 ubiquitin-protein ligase, partial [Lecanoromycetidae sp. Uapishka_2]
MDSSRLALVIFLLLFLFFSPDSQTPSLSQQRELDHSILDEKRALDVLNTSNYGALEPSQNRWVNVTGLRQSDGYAWEYLPKVQQRAKEQLQTVLDGFGSLSRFSNGSVVHNVSGDFSRQNTAEDVLSSTVSFSEPSPLYRNLTSTLHGQWIRSKIEEEMRPPSLNLSALAPRVYYTSKTYNRNITGLSGELRVQIEDGIAEENPHSEVSAIKAQITIKDEVSTGDGWEATLFGVHYPQQGGVLLSTTSEKFAGIFALPHFALSRRAYILAQQHLRESLAKTIEKQETDFTSASNPWTSSPSNPSEAMFPIPHCEYVVYLQQHPMDNPSINLEEVEQELRFPTGASVPAAPSIRMSALIFSPDCGFVLESQGPPDFAPQHGLHINGEKQEVHMRDARRCILAFATIICAQIYLLMRQMKDASTPSTKSRISFYTIAIMALGDGFACMGSMVTSMLVDAVFLPLIATAFLSFLCVSFFGMKFLMDIWSVQAPERQERERERQRERDRVSTELTASRSAPTTTSATVITAASADTLPLPVTARRPEDTGATPIIITPDQDFDAAEADDNAAAQTTTQTTVGSARREMSALYSKFYFLLLGILFLSLHATTWPTTLRSIYSNVLAFIYLSFWLPQIHRNVLRNCRKALRWEFVIGESILRLAPFVYFYTIPDNILFVTNDTNVAYVLIGWVWIQIWALVSQEILGPRFFVPSGYAPPAYDYHPILREDDEESGSTMPIGFTQATADPSSPTIPKPGESKEKGKKVWDCAICTENIEVPVLPAASSAIGENSAAVTATTIFSRRLYMVTPCRHIFHSQCLEGWMRYRLQCPICRENLPPL